MLKMLKPSTNKRKLGYEIEPVIVFWYVTLLSIKKLNSETDTKMVANDI